MRYFDHHFPGEIPAHRLFEPRIDTTPDRGTSLLVDDFLGGRHRAWAVVGTYGDNFDESARRAAQPLGLSGGQLEALRDLGIYLNYNGYGAEVADLHFPPDALFRRLQPYADPLAFIALDPAFGQLRDGFDQDMARARSISAVLDRPGHRLHLLPAEPWARRAGGVLANELARSAPAQAHALLTRLPAGGFVVSVRAPLTRRQGADDLCRRFPGGGGRPAAAGINRFMVARHGSTAPKSVGYVPIGGALPGAINVPLNDIRNAIGVLSKMTPYIAYCQSGRRSAAAAFILAQAGYDVYVLENGLWSVPKALQQ